MDRVVLCGSVPESSPQYSTSQPSRLSLAVCALVLALCQPLEAQQLGKMYRIGFLVASSPSAMAPRLDAFRQGLRELGIAEGKDIIIEQRTANGNADQLPGLAAELVRLNVDAIVTSGPTATRSAKEATSTIPIVMTFDDDPVGSGFAKSLARPGGNVTGLSTLAPEMSGKRLELLKETLPRLIRVAVIGTSKRQGTAQALKEMELAAPTFGIKLVYTWISKTRAKSSVYSSQPARDGPTHS